MWAAFSLGKIGDRDVLERFKELATDPSEVVSRRANSAAQELTERLGNSPN